jgi:hypothetical protein
VPPADTGRCQPGTPYSLPKPVDKVLMGCKLIVLARLVWAGVRGGGSAGGVASGPAMVCLKEPWPLRIALLVSFLLVGLALAVTDGGLARAQEPGTVWVDKEKGDDATCVRGDFDRPCKTVRRAEQIAQPGDEIATVVASFSWSETGIAVGIAVAAAAAAAALALAARGWYARRGRLR